MAAHITGDSPRAKAFRKAYARALVMTVWGAVALTSFLRRKQLGLVRGFNGPAQGIFASRNERWTAVYPTAEDFAAEDAGVGVEGQAGPPL